MRSTRHRGHKTVEAAVFLEGALQFASALHLEFTAYDTQYQDLQCNFLPLLKDGVIIGVISLTPSGEYQYRELVRDPTLPGAPRGG